MKFVHRINQALDELLGAHQEVILFGEDIVDPYGGAFKATKGLSTKYPDQVFSTPISEAAIIGMAGGMAIEGLLPIVEIMFGDFIMLGADQILNHLLKYQWMYNDKVQVPVTIRLTMGGRRGYGPTHSQSLENLLVSFPGIKVYSPSIYHDPGEQLKQIVLNESGLKIFSEYKLNYSRPLIDTASIQDGLSVRYSPNFPQTAHISNADSEKPELLIISYGGNSVILDDLLLELLMEHELPCQVNLPSLIKPFNYNVLVDGIESCKGVIIYEESTREFGWGAEVMSRILEAGHANDLSIVRVGAGETPIPSSRVLEEKVLPAKENLLAAIKSMGMI